MFILAWSPFPSMIKHFSIRYGLMVLAAIICYRCVLDETKDIFTNTIVKAINVE